MTPRRVAVVGPGGVGCFFAAHLAGAGHDVLACARRRFDRYVIESDTAPIEGPASVVVDPAEVGWAEPADWVLVGVKTHQTTGAAPWFDRLCGPDTIVVVMQNGIDGVARLAPLVGGAEVVAAVVYCGAELLAPGRVQNVMGGRLIVPSGPSGEALAELCAGTAIEIEPSEKYEVAVWVKLGVNVVANGLTALTGQPMGVLGHPAIEPVARALLRECWTVGAALGVALELDKIDDTIAAMAALEDGNTSMAQDVQAGRSTEYDALHGAVIRRAAQVGVPTPVHETVFGLLAARDPLDP